MRRYAHAHSMGVSESRLSAPLFSVTGMGTAAAPDFDYAAKINEATQKFQAENPELAAMARGAAAGYSSDGLKGAIGGAGLVSLSIGTKLVMAEPITGSALILAGLAAGYVATSWDDWASTLDDEARFPKIEKVYNGIAWDIAETMGIASRTNKTREGWRVYFRLGELVAKTNPKARAQGWNYAGPKDNDPDSTDEGGSFRTSKNSIGTQLGIESRWDSSWYEEVGSLGWATGRAGRRLLYLYNSIATLGRIKIALDGLPTTAARRSAFAGMLQHYVGESTLKGMDFLGSPTPVSKFITELMAAPYERITLNGIVPAPSAGQPQPQPQPQPQAAASSGIGSGGILAIAAAGIGTYLLVKG